MGSRILAASLATVSAFSQSEPKPIHRVRRICVDTLSGTAAAAGPARDLALAALFRSKRFTVLEKCDKADATLKGSIATSTEIQSRSESESIGFGVGSGRADRHGASGGFAIGSNGESFSSTEKSQSASVSLRLVNDQGEVVWAYTQDSPAGKTLSAPALAMERAIQQLLREAGPAPAQAQ